MKTRIKRIDSTPSNSANDVLSEVLKAGAQKMLAAAIESEVAEYVATFEDQLDENGKRLVVRNGFHPCRKIQTGLGDIEVTAPRVNDRRFDEDGNRIRFTSSILPPYLRRTKSVEELIPWLYLKGISTGDFSEALTSLLGPDAGGLSATTVTRMKEKWGDEYDDWSNRNLAGKKYVYWWADGIYFNVRLGNGDRVCMMVIIGALEDGKKELVAVVPGVRESILSWKEVLLNLRDRGLQEGPELATADGALGFWGAMSEVFPNSDQQMCWVHKIANVLDKIPKTRQPQAKAMLHEIYNADTGKEAERAFDRFSEVFNDKYPRAVKSLMKNRERLLTFYNYPAAHWQHIRTSNPIESTFATVRLRSKRTKGCGSERATVMMVFKLVQCAEKRWRKLRGYEQLADVIDINFYFEDGIRMKAA